MSEDLSFNDAQKAMRIWLGKLASKELKVLVETKHLYQKIEIPFAATAQELYNRVYSGQYKDQFAIWINQSAGTERFELELNLTEHARISIAVKSALPLALPHLSLFCNNCGRREAFMPLRHADLIGEIRAEIALGKSKPFALPDDFQMFSLVYQCQSCLGTPESLLVRREGWTLSLQGRSPMEHIEVPKYLPKIETPFYRDAVIAFNSGKILAALFYLRTFIEQFGRRITGLTGKATGDEIFDAYYKTLEAKHADQMPSLRDWYDKLSESVHSAREDAALFESAKSEIEKHFDFRRIFGILEPKPVASPAIAAHARPSDSK